MSNERTEIALEFYCDGPECESIVTFRHDGTPSGTDFMACRRTLTNTHGWISTKQISQPWEDYCKLCHAFAEDRHARYKQREAQRDRIRERNAE